MVFSVQDDIPDGNEPAGILFKKILVAVDGSQNSAQLCEHMLSLQKEFFKLKRSEQRVLLTMFAGAFLGFKESIQKSAVEVDSKKNNFSYIA
nr:hypothetical protein [uncultured Nitrososphaera sp.]